jgi:hypothetical protein
MSTDLIAFGLRPDYDEFSGGSVALVDGISFDVGEALEEGGGKIVLGLEPRKNSDGDLTEAEGARSLRDAQVADALKNYPALESVEVEDGDEPASYAEVDVISGSGPSLSDLRKRASELDITGRSSMDKEQLAEAIATEEAELASESAQREVEEEHAQQAADSASEQSTDQGGDAAGDGQASIEGSGD